MPARKPDLVPGTLDMLLLTTLRRGPMHGYAIAQEIKTVSRKALTVEQGSLYPALYRLERQGHVKSRWGISDTKRRVKTYQLTRAGRAHLKRQAADWSAFVSAVSRIMRYKG